MVQSRLGLEREKEIKACETGAGAAIWYRILPHLVPRLAMGALQFNRKTGEGGGGVSLGIGILEPSLPHFQRIF